MNKPDAAYILKVAHQFCLQGEPTEATPYGNGHINDTYLLSTPVRRYILQRLSRQAFPRPDWVMENISRVTEHLRRKIAASGGDPERETLTLVPTHSGCVWYVDAAGDSYRVYLFIERTRSLDLPDTPALFEQSAYSFGMFQRQLEDFPAETLHETIKDFHNTPARFAQLRTAVENNSVGRLNQVQAEWETAQRYERETHALIDARLPLRVTHNDTKLSNLLLDAQTGAGLCVIDLDTVMPGLAAYDYGDSIRSGANTAAEDESDASNVHLSLTMFSAYTRGYLRAVGAALTPREISLLPEGAKLMTLECGMRFLADYLNGDIYFRIRRPGHNLSRARSQFKLVSEMEQHWQQLSDIAQGEAHALHLL